MYELRLLKLWVLLKAFMLTWVWRYSSPSTHLISQREFPSFPEEFPLSASFFPTQGWYTLNSYRLLQEFEDQDYNSILISSKKQAGFLPLGPLKAWLLRAPPSRHLIKAPLWASLHSGTLGLTHIYTWVWSLQITTENKSQVNYTYLLFAHVPLLLSFPLHLVFSWTYPNSQAMTKLFQPFDNWSQCHSLLTADEMPTFRPIPCLPLKSPEVHGLVWHLFFPTCRICYE